MTASLLFHEHQQWAERMAARFVREHGVPGFIADAVTNSALIGLWNAAQAFRVQRGCEFRAFAYCRVVGSMKDEMREQAGPNSDKQRLRHGAVRAVATFTQESVTHETGLSKLEARETYEELVACKLLEVS